MATKKPHREGPRSLTTSCKLIATGDVTESRIGFASIQVKFDDFLSSEKSKGYFRKSEWQVKARLERQPQRQTPDIYRQPRRVFLNRET